MKFLVPLALLLLLLPFGAFAQTTPAIDSIFPPSAPTAGGVEVTITGRGFSPTIVCILPCPTTVLFGTTEVTPKSESDTRLVVTAPPHAEGPVDITVKIPDGRSVTRENGFFYGSPAEADYEKVLLPVYLDGTVAGANGTQWRTDFWVRNGGASSVLLAPWECPPGSACPAVFPLTKTLVAGESLHNLPVFFRPPTANPGRMLFVSRSGAENVAMQLRFADVSRASLNGGTEMPVVREKSFRSGKVSLLNVPLDSRYRLLLRVYDVAHTEARFRVTFYAQAAGTGNTPEHSVELTATSNDTGDFRLSPAYAQYSIDQLLQLPRVWPDALRIEIEPLTPGSRFWAFASVTNNDTQLVTLVTPQ